MDNISKLYESRNAVSKEISRKAFNCELMDSFPYVVNNANYFVFGEDPDKILDRYFKDPAVMYNRQIEQFENHYSLVEDHYVPYLMPFMGCGVLSTAFGSKVEFQDKMDPAPAERIVKRLEDLDRLEMPDLRKDGLLPHIINFLEYFKANSDLPVGVTDVAGPLETALQLLPYDMMFYAMFECPEKIHKLMDLVTEALIGWIKVQKEVIGEPTNCCAGNQGVYVPDGIGIWLSDDDAVILSPALYDEFVLPYNERVLEAFGGGIIHWCGCANQHIPSLNKMKSLRGINNFALGDAKALYDLRVGLNKDIAIVACDFTPIDYEGYYRTLFEDLKIPKQGLIVQSLFSPMTGVKDKKYELMRRDERDVVPDVARVLQKYANL